MNQNCPQKHESDSEDEKPGFTLYALLGLEKSATEQELKKQYRLLALKFHPDKNQGDQQAKEMFQRVAEAYQILSDPERRKVYDQTGLVQDEQEYEQAYEYFRHLFPKVSEQDIVDFEKRYRYGPMEEEDLLNFYVEHKGDVRTLLESIPLSLNEDIPRYIAFYQQKIEQKLLTKHKIFDFSKDKVFLLKDESKLAELQKQNMKTLTSQIVARKGNFENMMKALEEKYSQPKRLQKKVNSENYEQEVKIKKKLKKNKVK